MALQAHTVLSVAGRPVALTTEHVYWQVVTHRAHQAAAPAHLLNGAR